MIRTCCHDGFPLVWSLEQPGAELHCLTCGGWFGLFNAVLTDPTPSRSAQLDHATALFHSGERGPVDPVHLVPPEPAMLPADVDEIVCDGCGKGSGRSTTDGKPAAWYQRALDGRDWFACTRECISSIGDRTGTSKVVLPW